MSKVSQFWTDGASGGVRRDTFSALATLRSSGLGKPEFALFEAGSQSESERSVMRYCVAKNIATIALPVQSLWSLKPGTRPHDMLKQGFGFVVGSGGFVQSAMSRLGVVAPQEVAYPSSLERHLLRRLRYAKVCDVVGMQFVKPLRRGVFTPFICDTMTDPASMSEGDRDLHEKFYALHPLEPVIMSDPAQWVSKYRFYVDEGRVVGYAPLPEGGVMRSRRGFDALAAGTSIALPDLSAVQAMADDFQQPSANAGLGGLGAVGSGVESDSRAPCAYAMDVGVLADGKTSLIRVRDFWALDVLPGPDSIDAARVVHMLHNRWAEITLNQRQFVDVQALSSAQIRAESAPPGNPTFVHDREGRARMFGSDDAQHAGQNAHSVSAVAQTDQSRQRSR